MKKLNKFLIKSGSLVVFLLTGVWPVFASNTGGVPAPAIKPYKKQCLTERDIHLQKIVTMKFIFIVYISSSHSAKRLAGE
ncbi:hypothetical protein [Vibrio parahaemolyticus]|uniref:hypothetical protein n=1 Tax=Vibrio parahaemolyticus TaxID=670 RepID=UPI003AAFB760